MMNVNIPVGVAQNESSGSEHSADLSKLLNSYFEREFRDQQRGILADADHEADEEAERLEGDLALQESLDKLLNDNKNDGDVVKSNIHAEMSRLSEGVGGAYLPDFKRRLMANLLDEGFDAGLCKSKWKRNGRCNAGEYEYIDINTGGSRYIVEVALAGQFTVARPTQAYTTLLEKIPPVFVGKPEELRTLVAVMCKAMKKSMKSADMHVPPWRRLTYMQAKWFSSHKRTVNEIPARRALCIGRDFVGTRLMGFAPVGASSSGELGVGASEDSLVSC